jgi:hypothetical protein
VAGRRSPRPVVGECWLPGASGAPEPVRPTELDETAPVPIPIARTGAGIDGWERLVGVAGAG